MNEAPSQSVTDSRSFLSSVKAKNQIKLQEIVSGKSSSPMKIVKEEETKVIVKP